MILGIGTDLVENARLESWLGKPALLAKYFSPQERRDVAESQHPAASLAARFAAREAFGKALGTGLAGLSLKDVAVSREPGGRPVFQFGATALAALERLGVGKVHLSLSHEKGYSLAFVIAEA